MTLPEEELKMLLREQQERLELYVQQFLVLAAQKELKLSQEEPKLSQVEPKLAQVEPKLPLKKFVLLPEDWRANLNDVRQQLIDAGKPKWVVKLITIRCLFEFLLAAIKISVENCWLPAKSKAKKRISF